ncbi:MAG: BLUF domain-containing protein [Hyphomicrobium sp.]
MTFKKARVTLDPPGIVLVVEVVYGAAAGATLPQRGAAMPLMQLIYASRPFGFDDLALAGILSTARRNNERDAITGSLICREDLYLQLLEGGRDVVNAAFDKIARDDRHMEVVKLVAADVETRFFPQWAMRHDPARSWMWSRDEVEAGAIGRATPDEVRSVFERLAREAPGGAACPVHPVPDPI